MSKRLQALIEQTQFLMTSQAEAKEVCVASFKALIAQIDKKIRATRGEQAQRLQRVCDMLAGQAEELVQETDGDIDFLRGQLKALTEITKVSDQAKAKAMLDMVIDPSEEVGSTADFKKGVMEELALAQEGFKAVLEDVSAALEEGDIASVEMMLEQMAASSAEDEEDDEDADEDYEDADEDGCCGSGGCSTGGGCGDCKTGCGESKDGVNIFESLHSYDRELAKDKKNGSDRH